MLFSATVHLAGDAFGSPVGLVTTLTVAMALLVAIALAGRLAATRPTERRVPVRATALRQRVEQPAYRRLSDPARAGRPRPRAPSDPPAA